jgi:hypothetical protein
VVPVRLGPVGYRSSVHFGPRFRLSPILEPSTPPFEVHFFLF